MSRLNVRSSLFWSTGDSPVVGLVAVLAASAAIFSQGAPTELLVWDAFLKALLAVTVVAAASKAPRWVVIVMASTAAAFSGFSGWGLLAWAALLVAVGAGVLHRRNRLAGAVAAGAAVQALLRLPALFFFGLPSLIAAVACGLVLAAGYRYSTTRVRRITRRSVGAAAALTSILVLIGVVSLVNVRTEVDIGVAAARRGLAAARSGNTSGVVAELTRAETALGSANERASSMPARALRLFPVAAQHQRVIEVATSAGAQVARDAAGAIDADIASISLSAGSVDLAALRTMAPQLRQTANSLQMAIDSLEAVDSAWVLAPLGDRIAELTKEIDALQPEILLAADAAESIPSMLGIDTPDTYFVIFGTPAESREFGGFIGSWALLTFDNGRLQLGDSGRIIELNSLTREVIVTPGTVSGWFMSMARPTQFPQNLTSSPDFAQVAEISRQVLAGVSETPLDGFIYLDAWALGDLIELTGPVEIPFQDEPLTADNAAQFFFRDQYEFDGTFRTELFDTLAVVAGTVLERIEDQTLPGPEELGRILGPAARAGHLQVITFDDQHNDFLRSVKLLRDFGRDETSDFVGLVQTNGLSNKMDLYLERTLDYRVQLGAQGLLSATATATLRSVVPPGAPELTLGQGESQGLNRVLLSLYTPHALTGVSINGSLVDFRSTVEFELARYLVELDVPPTGEPFVVEFTLSGVLPPNSQYSLEVWQQPLVNTDSVAVSVQGAGTSIDWSGPLVENLVIRADGEVSRE